MNELVRFLVWEAGLVNDLDGNLTLLSTMSSTIHSSELSRSENVFAENLRFQI